MEVQGALATAHFLPLSVHICTASDLRHSRWANRASVSIPPRPGSCKAPLLWLPSFLLLYFIIYSGLGMCSLCWGQRLICKSLSSPSNMRIPGMEFRSSCSTPSAFSWQPFFSCFCQAHGGVMQGHEQFNLHCLPWLLKASTLCLLEDAVLLLTWTRYTDNIPH